MATGRIVARVFTSDADIPIENAAVSIIRRDGEGGKELLAFRLTNMDGLTKAFALTTPDAEESQSNLPGAAPFTTVDIKAQQVGYDSILVENAQVFPSIETRQDIKLIPTAELPDSYDRTEVFNIEAQNL